MSYPQSLSPSKLDFVRSDFDALASHMQQCESARGRWSTVRGHLQSVHAMAAGRIVTLACAVLIVGFGIALST